MLWNSCLPEVTVQSLHGILQARWQYIFCAGQFEPCAWLQVWTKHWICDSQATAPTATLTFPPTPHHLKAPVFCHRQPFLTGIAKRWDGNGMVTDKSKCCLLHLCVLPPLHSPSFAFSLLPPCSLPLPLPLPSSCCPSLSFTQSSCALPCASVVVTTWVNLNTNIVTLGRYTSPSNCWDSSCYVQVNLIGWPTGSNGKRGRST